MARTTTDSCDYPDFGKAVGKAVAGGEAEKGILVCGSGVGISISANKVKGIRAGTLFGYLFRAFFQNAQ